MITKIIELGQPCSEKLLLVSWGGGTYNPTCKKNTFEKLKMFQNWLKNDKNLLKGIQYNPKTLNSFVKLLDVNFRVEVI